MRRLSVWGIGALLLLVAGTVFAQGAVEVVANVNLSLRAGPSATAARFATVPYETELTAIAISSDRNWVAVNYNGQNGWLSLEYTGVLSGSLGGLPVSDQVFARTGGGGVTSSVVVAPVVNLRFRMEPTLTLRPAGAVPVGTELPALAVSDDGLFVQVSYNGIPIWLYVEYVTELRGSISSLSGAPVIPAGPAPAVGGGSSSDSSAPLEPVTEPPAEEPLPQNVCDCSGDTLNCGDFSRHSDAQACFEYCFSLRGYDVHRLDRDNNGWACENSW